MAITETVWDTPEKSRRWTASAHGTGKLVGREAERERLRRCVRRESSRQKEASGLLPDMAERHPLAGTEADAKLAVEAAAIAEQSGLAEHRNRLSGLLAGSEEAAPAPADRPDGAAVQAESPRRTAALAAFGQAVADQPGAARRTTADPDTVLRGGPLEGQDQLTMRIAVASVAHLSDEPDACPEHYRAADTCLPGRRAFGLRAW